MPETPKIPLPIMTGRGNIFSTTIVARKKDESGKITWVEEVKTYDIAGIPLDLVTEYFNDNVSIGAQFINLKDEASKGLQDKWLPLVISKNRVGLCLDDLLKDGFDTKNLRELWRAVLDLSGF